MKIFIDIGHPAHVHLFKNLIFKLNKTRHELLITARNKEVTFNLLDSIKISYISRPGSKKGLFYKGIGFLIITKALYSIAKKFKPDLLIGGVGNVYISILGKLIKKPSIIFDDTEHAKYELFFIKKFASNIITPTCYLKDFGKKQICYNGYHELTYLHPNYFNPDPSIFKLLKIKEDEKFFIMRFVSWDASHDIGHSGLSLEMKRKAVKELSKYARVFISSEGELPEDLKPYQIRIPPEKMHDVLAFATLFIGEGATMASECAVLGTTALYINSIEVGYCTEEEEKYGLIYNFRKSKGVIEKALELFNTPNLKQVWQKHRQKMLANKIDVTAFMVWFVENYPESVKIMKENPDYQYNFK